MCLYARRGCYSVRYSPARRWLATARSAGQDVIICAIGSFAMDDPVVLRPVIEDDLLWLERMRNDPAGAGPHEWHGWRNPGALSRQSSKYLAHPRGRA